jgi:hypothetical protein
MLRTTGPDLLGGTAGRPCRYSPGERAYHRLHGSRTVPAICHAPGAKAAGRAAIDLRVKGIVFNLLEQVVSRDYGEDMWDDLLSAAGLVGAYTSLGSYPDEHLSRT